MERLYIKTLHALKMRLAELAFNVPRYERHSCAVQTKERFLLRTFLLRGNGGPSAYSHVKFDQNYKFC